MSFIKMVTAQCIAIVVSTTAVMGVGKQNIFVLVIANPIVTTFRFGEVFGFATQSTTRLFFNFLCRCF